MHWRCTPHHSRACPMRDAGRVDNLAPMQIELLSDRYLDQFKEMFVDYFVSDLKAPFAPEVIRDQIAPKPAEASAAGYAPVLLAVDGDRAVGFIQFQIDSEESDWNDRPGWGFIRECYVRRDYRRRGVGTALVQTADASMREAGASRAYLTCEDNFAFWESMGWERTGQTAPNGGEVLELAL